MMLLKATLVTALLGFAMGDQSYLDSQFGVRDSGYGHHSSGAGIDPITASAGIGVLNAGYSTLWGLSNAQRNRDVCNKVNEMLNVGDLATQTIATSTANTDLQTIVNNLVNKINEIIQKSTLSC
jgi:hypothetical protein